MIATPLRDTTRDTEALGGKRERTPHRPVPPPLTRRQELRRAAAVQAAWLADLR